MNPSPSCHAPAEWMQPLSADAPCGPSLEYDPDYAVLAARMQPRGEAQYGDFIVSRGSPEWTEIERQCRQLLVRTRDIDVLIWLCRSRVSTAGAFGLAQGLGTLADMLERWPADLHPQVHGDGEADPAVRANAIAALCDPDGLLGEVRDIAVSSNVMRLLVRDVERAIAVERSGSSSQAIAVRRQLDALRLQARSDDSAPVRHLAHAAFAARRIQHWCAQHLAGSAPDLRPLLQALDPYGEANDAEAKLPDPSDVVSEAGTAPATGASGPQRAAHERHEALRNIQEARDWFELNEPSSPVAVLLKQAERMVGQRFAVLADAIPLDLLRKWDADVSLQADAERFDDRA